MLDFDTLRDDLTIVLRDDGPLLIRRNHNTYRVWINQWQVYENSNMLTCFDRLITAYDFMDEPDTASLPAFDMVNFCEMVERLLEYGELVTFNQNRSWWPSRGHCGVYKSKASTYRGYCEHLEYEIASTTYAAAAQLCLDYFTA